MNAAEEKEIVKKYEEATDKCGMINILTQLYDCKRADMVELLERNVIRILEQCRRKNQNQRWLFRN